MKHICLVLVFIAVTSSAVSAQIPDPNCSEKANELLRQAWEAQPLNIPVNNANPGKAKTLYQQALVDSPRCRRASRGLVGLLIRSKKYREASAYNQSFLQLFPDDTAGLSEKADLLVRLDKDYPRALEIELKLLEVPGFNNNGNVFYKIALIYSSMQRIDESLDYLRRAIEVDPGWGNNANAQADPAFKNLRKDKRFSKLVKK